MRQALDISPDEIVREGLLRRRVATSEVRRVHLYSDANGEEGLVVRRALFRFVHVSRSELSDPAVSQRVRALVDAVRQQARVDDGVDHFLASVA
jgi:hypothetical protein